jgi:hypothetical protein
MLSASGWTPEMVNERLEAYFKERPDSAIMSRVRFDPTTVVVEGAALVNATGAVLGYDAETRFALLTMAYVRATGAKLADLYASRGRSRRTFYRQAGAGAHLVATWLNQRNFGIIRSKVPCW